MALSSEQVSAARILLSAGAGRISLAGGAALIAHGLTDRTTKDLDAFTRDSRANLDEIANNVVRAFLDAGYRVRDESKSKEVRTFFVTRQRRGARGRPIEPVQVQLCRDYQLLDSVPSPVGATIAPIELVANKILAVYDRPRARDADDVARLLPRFDMSKILAVADRKQADPQGLDRLQLATGFHLLTRIPDSKFPYVNRARDVKEYMKAIALSLRDGTPLTAKSPYQNDAPAARGATVNRSRTLCGARTADGTPCRNVRGTCPHHR